MKFVVSVLGQKGGVGKSTLARALAVAATKGGIRAKLIDLDYRQLTSARWAETRLARANVQIPTHSFRSINMALPMLNSADMLIIDTPGYITEETDDIATLSHLVILPTGVSTDDLHPTLSLVEDLIRRGLPKERLVIALCRLFDGREEEVARDVLRFGGYEVLAGSIPEEAEYRRAHNRGQTIIETSDPVLNRRANEVLASALRRILGERAVSSSLAAQAHSFGPQELR